MGNNEHVAKRKTAREKLNVAKEPHIEDMPANLVARYGAGGFLIPTPKQVDALIREIPYGETRTASSLRGELATRSGAVTSCPLCFGIFWRLAAEAAEEDRAEGRTDITPYWRVVKEGGKFNEKLPGGIEAHRALIVAEAR